MTDAAFKVTLRPSGNVYDVPPGATVLDAGMAAGMAMPYNCRAGSCGTCRALVLKGEVDYGNVHAAYLTEKDKQRGFALLCRAKPLGDLEIEVAELDLAQVAPRVIPCRVKRIRRVRQDVAIVDLRLPMNENLLFAPGQHVDVMLPDGQARSYSIASEPAAEGVIALELHVRHSPGGLFTDRVFSTLKEGELLRVRGPLGTFYLREKSTKPVVLVATGTGISPFLSMLRYAAMKKIDRPMRLYWGGRRHEDFYAEDLMRGFEQQLPLTYVPVLSRARREDGWTGATGYVQHAVLRDLPDLSGHQVYACGSPAMVAAAARDFISDARLPENEFFGDAFLSAADVASAA